MVDPQLDEFYIIVMSKINDQLQSLRASIENIRKNMDKVEMENALLKINTASGSSWPVK